MQVRGTFTGDATVGITVNGSPAYIVGNAFVSEELQFSAQPTVNIEVIATNLAGESATQTIPVATNGPELPLVMASVQRASFRNTDIQFHYEFETSLPVQSVSVDFDNNGTPEYTGTSLDDAPKRFRYASPGIHTARVSVTTTGPTYQFDQWIAVLDFAQHRSRPCLLYGLLRQALTNNDVPAALLVFPEENRSSYETLFNALGANRPTMADRLGTIANGIYGLNRADLYLVYDDNGVDMGAPYGAAQGADGVWRIESL